MAAMVVLSLFDPLHDPVRQHMSESIMASPWLALAVKILPSITGISIMVFGLGCFALKRGWTWAGLAGLLFGAAMLANGIFPTGDPRHGLYGLAIFSVLLPAFFAAEFDCSQRLKQLSLAVAFINLLYMWILFTGLDPEAFRGLTQRIASLIMFGWFALLSRA
ncbi:DUF998 domain-containing protein [Altererythrobacter lutimaris]|nr:DUF998 domain-containing protein [Altererythrobacter lutimaris]